MNKFFIIIAVITVFAMPCAAGNLVFEAEEEQEIVVTEPSSGSTKAVAATKTISPVKAKTANNNKCSNQESDAKRNPTEQCKDAKTVKKNKR